MIAAPEVGRHLRWGRRGHGGGSRSPPWSWSPRGAALGLARRRRSRNGRRLGRPPKSGWTRRHPRQKREESQGAKREREKRPLEVSLSPDRDLAGPGRTRPHGERLKERKAFFLSWLRADRDRDLSRASHSGAMEKKVRGGRARTSGETDRTGPGKARRPGAGEPKNESVGASEVGRDEDHARHRPTHTHTVGLGDPGAESAAPSPRQTGITDDDRH